MKRCALCGRKLSNTRYTFGLGCLKKMCYSVNVPNVKNLKGESLLDKKILKLCNKKTLPLIQRQLLTDRYLTLNLLNEVPLGCYDNYRSLLQNDNNFKECLNKIIEKYGNKNQFNTGDYNESLAFEDGDLFLALHNAYINVIGNQKENGKWNLDITLSDKYDFTDFKEIGEYIKDDNFWKGFIGSVANNLAMIGTACNVVNEYNITIKFKFENWEG